MGIFETIASGFIISAKNLKLWLLLVLISVALMIVSLPIVMAMFGGAVPQPGVEPSPEALAKINWFLFALFIIASVVIQFFINAGITGSMKDILKTNTLNLGNFLTYAKKYFVRFVIFGLITFGVAFVIIIIVTLLGALTAAIGNAVNILGILLGIVLAIASLFVFLLIGVCASFIPSIIVIEDKPVIESIRASINFIKGKFWKCAGLVVSLFLIIFGIALISGTITRQGGNVNYIFQILTNLVNVFLTIVYTACVMSFYISHTTTNLSPAEGV